MAESKAYEVGGFRFEFVPQGGPYQGDLMTMLPEMPPYAGDINFAKKRSRAEHANDVTETQAVEKGAELTKELKKALNTLYIRLKEEVAAEREADAEETHPEVGQEEIDELVGDSGVLDRFAECAAAFSNLVGERSALFTTSSRPPASGLWKTSRTPTGRSSTLSTSCSRRT